MAQRAAGLLVGPGDPAVTNRAVPVLSKSSTLAMRLLGGCSWLRGAACRTGLGVSMSVRY